MPCTSPPSPSRCVFFFTDTAPTDIYTLSLHDALPISRLRSPRRSSQRQGGLGPGARSPLRPARSEEHTSELQSLTNLVCRLLLEKKKLKRHQDAKRLGDDS